MDNQEAIAKYFLDPSTLESSSSMSSWKLPEKIIYFSADYKIGYIPNTYHDPKEFGANVAVQFDDNTEDVKAKSTLRYLYNKRYSRILKLKFNVDAEDIGLNSLVADDAKVQIVISHIILPATA